jgi:hypothetical protein
MGQPIQFRPAAAATAALCLLLIGVLLAGDAQARRYGYVKPYYSETYETRGPARGYEGFLFPDYYCSYKRFPNRVCNTDKRGRETCRVKGWRLEQTCQ